MVIENNVCIRIPAQPLLLPEVSISETNEQSLNERRKKNESEKDYSLGNGHLDCLRFVPTLHGPKFC